MAFALPLRKGNRCQRPPLSSAPRIAMLHSQLLAHIEPLGQELDKTKLDDHISVGPVLSNPIESAPPRGGKARRRLTSISSVTVPEA